MAAKKKTAAKKTAAKKAAPKKAAKKKAAKKTAAKKTAAPEKAAVEATVAPQAEVAEAPLKEASVAEASVAAASVAEAPVKEASVAEAPAKDVVGGGELDVAALVAKAVAEAEPEKPKTPAELLPKMPRMRARRADGVITLAYGTEADQAFMVYALSTEKVDTEDRVYKFVRADLQALGEDAQKSIYDVTAISFGDYPALRARYVLLPCGGGYGDHQGPVLVSRSPIRSNEVEGLEAAVPGLGSAPALALRLWLAHHELKLVSMATREICLRVRASHVRSGLLVDEDIVTYRNHSLVRVVDLGQWWGEQTEGLPLALNANIIRRDIPAEERSKIALDIKRSIAYALGHREEALDWAMQFAGKRPREILDKYISRYVNDLSLDCGERGRQAARLLFRDAGHHGFLPEVYEPVYHGDEGLE